MRSSRAASGCSAASRRAAAPSPARQAPTSSSSGSARRCAPSSASSSARSGRPLRTRDRVRRAPGAVERRLEVGAVLDEQPHHLRRGVPAHGPLQRVLALAPVRRAAREQHPRRVQPSALRRVRERHRAAEARARVEQQLEACRVLGAGRDPQRAAVVGVGSGREQQRRQPRLVREAGSAVQRASCARDSSSSHAAFGVRAGARAGPRRRRRGRRCARRRGRPSRRRRAAAPSRARRAGGSRAAGVARPARRRRARCRPAPARRRAPPARQAGIERQQRLGIVAPRARRPFDERPRALAARHRPRLRLAHERRPAAGAELARDRQLRVGELRRAVGRRRLGREHALARPRVAAARRPQQRLGLAPRAGEIDTPSVHHDHLRGAGGPQHGRRSIERAGTWPSPHRGGPGALPADRVRPRARQRSYRRARARRKAAARCAMLGPMSPRRTDRAVAEAAPLEAAKAAAGARGRGLAGPARRRAAPRRAAAAARAALPARASRPTAGG